MTMGKARIIIQILANNRALRGSLASSALSPFIWLWNDLTALQWAAVISALVLTAGAIVEYRHQMKLLAFLALKWILRKSTPFDRCAFKRLLLHSIGPILVVIGIGGEVIFEGRTFVVEDRQEEQAQAIVGSLQGKADAVNKEADVLTMRLDIASAQMSALEIEIAAQGPRAKLLAKAAPALVESLAAFPDQRVRLFICGQFGSPDGETFGTWGAIVGMLNTDGAKWKIEHGGLEYFDRCSPSGARPLSEGMMVFVNKFAPKPTMEAAKALGEGLAKALPPSPNKMPGLIDPEFSKKYSQLTEGKDTPWAMVANDPDLITVLIGAHPQQETTTTKANH